MKSFIVGLSLLLVSSTLSAKVVVLKTGEQLTVVCEGGAAGTIAAPAPAKSERDRCDSFHSEGPCQDAFIGDACINNDTKGTCMRMSNFGGKATCSCK